MLTDDEKIPHWVRYTALNRFFNMTDLAREHIDAAVDAELEAMTS